ncbi:hypothetical protein [Xenorhabdus bharatensis]|uniref:hypothetical protein n=1 Tax=Xenorhabdus bharatensis TaxID=3136256 RepID=UPI0030F374DF
MADKSITGTFCNLKNKDDCYSATINISDVYEPNTTTDYVISGFSLVIVLVLFFGLIYNIYKAHKLS